MLKVIRAKFAKKGDLVATGPLFDRRSSMVYALAAVGLLACLCILSFSDFTLGSHRLPRLFVSLCWIVMSALLARRYGFWRTAMVLEAVAVPSILTSMGLVLVIGIAAISGPFVDDQLAQFDAGLGLDWVALYHFYAVRPALLQASHWAYQSFAFQIVAVPVVLCAWRRGDMFWPYLAAFSLAFVITLAIFPFAPAAGPFNHYGIPREGLDVWQWNFGPYIDGLRSGEIRNMSATSAGLISVPSFHAAMGVLFMWACSGIAYARWPIYLLNLAMIASTPIMGAHYFVDVIAGVVVALVAIGVSPLVAGGCAVHHPVRSRPSWFRLSRLTQVACL